ncbi:LysR family transcriptional regulator [Afipia sp. Root123D2]|uniref:LysR family transcriptional regulator n=1 Tax=Afipia sp. Root123D2 TaxID=1736436 RepID=UPI0009EAD5B8|nr:LysR family transcriptional regulator [Afipia sp. Root123D2]
MDMRKLRYFSVLAEEKHFGRAAARLSLSQPPLSLAIRQLESEIGAKLFERDSRNVSLTPAGDALQQEAIFLLRRAEESRLLVKAISEGKGGRLRIGFSGSMLYRGLPNIISAFKTASPTTELLLRELNTVEQISAFGRDEIDLGFTFGRAIPEELEGFHYHSEPFVACLPAGHRYASAKRISLTKLENEEFILFTRDVSPDYHQSIVAACLAVGFAPKIRHEVRHWLSVVSFVAQGIGVSLVPASLAKSNVSNVFFVPLSDARLYSETWCVWNPEGSAGVSIRNAIDAARIQSRAMAKHRGARAGR